MHSSRVEANEKRENYGVEVLSLERHVIYQRLVAHMESEFKIID